MARKRSGTESDVVANAETDEVEEVTEKQARKPRQPVPVVRPEFGENALLTLRQAAAYAGVKPGRIRKLMQGDAPRIHGRHEEIEGTGIKVWRVPFPEVKSFADEMDAARAGETTVTDADGKVRKVRVRRESTRGVDGKQYVLRLTQEQFAIVRPLLEAQGVELESRYKSREARKAAKAAAAATETQGDVEVAEPTFTEEDAVEDEVAVE
jgi:hypothetical protein